MRSRKMIKLKKFVQKIKILTNNLKLDNFYAFWDMTNGLLIYCKLLSIFRRRKPEIKIIKVISYELFFLHKTRLGFKISLVAINAKIGLQNRRAQQ